MIIPTSEAALLMDELKTWIESEIKSCENTAEELIQERDNPEAAEREFGKIAAFKEVIQYIKEERW